MARVLPLAPVSSLSTSALTVPPTTLPPITLSALFWFTGRACSWVTESSVLRPSVPVSSIDCCGALSSCFLIFRLGGGASALGLLSIEAAGVGVSVPTLCYVFFLPSLPSLLLTLKFLRVFPKFGR